MFAGHDQDNINLWNNFSRISTIKISQKKSEIENFSRFIGEKRNHIHTHIFCRFFLSLLFYSDLLETITSNYMCTSSIRFVKEFEAPTHSSHNYDYLTKMVLCHYLTIKKQFFFSLYCSFVFSISIRPSNHRNISWDIPFCDVIC